MRMSTNISGSFNAFLMEYLPCLQTILSAPLVNSKEGVSEVIDKLDAYYLSKDDWDTLMSLSLEKNEMEKIPSATKSAFTREYNSREHRFSTGSVVKLHKIAESIPVEEGGEEVESVREEETNVENNEQDTTKQEEEIVSKFVRSKAVPGSSKASSKGSKMGEKGGKKSRKTVTKK